MRACGEHRVEEHFGVLTGKNEVRGLLSEGARNEKLVLGSNEMLGRK